MGRQHVSAGPHDRLWHRRHRRHDRRRWMRRRGLQRLCRWARGTRHAPRAAARLRRPARHREVAGNMVRIGRSLHAVVMVSAVNRYRRHNISNNLAQDLEWYACSLRIRHEAVHISICSLAIYSEAPFKSRKRILDLSAPLPDSYSMLRC